MCVCVCVCEGMMAYVCRWYYESLFACAGVCVSLSVIFPVFVTGLVYFAVCGSVGRSGVSEGHGVQDLIQQLQGTV